MAKLFIITGPAGVGKSTVSKLLAEKLTKCAVVEGDELYNQVVGGAKPWLEGNHTDVMWKNLIDLTKNYLDANIDVVVNYIVYQKRLNQVLESLAKYEIHFVVLTACAGVVAARDESRDADVQVHRVETHLKEFAAQGYDEKFMLSTENISIEEEVERILTGDFLLQTSVDDGHFSGLQKLYFDMVKSGEKLFEIRLNDEKRQNIKVGDSYVFGLEPERRMCVRKTIKNRLEFKDFSEAAEKLDFKKVGFSSRDEMKIVYNTIYSKEKQDKFGVVAFELE